MNQNESIHRLIPHPELDAEDFDRLAAREGWSFDGEIEEDEDEGRSHQLVFSTRDGRTTINVVDDIYSRIRYVAMKGDQAASLYEKLSRDKDWFYDRESILAAPAHAQSPAESIRAIYHIGVSAPPKYDEEYFMVFDAFFGHPDPNVRRETVTAMAYADWPEFRPVLERVVEEDPDESVCETAKEFLNYRE